MLNSEQIFRLSSVALLGLLFVSVTAIADKNESKSQAATSVYAQVALVDEANAINNGALAPSQLTTIGDRLETLATTVSQNLK